MLTQGTLESWKALFKRNHRNKLCKPNSISLPMDTDVSGHISEVFSLSQHSPVPSAHFSTCRKSAAREAGGKRTRTHRDFKPRQTSAHFPVIPHSAHDEGFLSAPEQFCVPQNKMLCGKTGGGGERSLPFLPCLQFAMVSHTAAGALKKAPGARLWRCHTRPSALQTRPCTAGGTKLLPFPHFFPLPTRSQVGSPAMRSSPRTSPTPYQTLLAFCLTERGRGGGGNFTLQSYF